MKSILRKNCTITGAYLHEDGHCVVIYEQDVRLGKSSTRIEFCEIWEEITKARMDFEGRVVFHRYHTGALLEVARLARSIRCKPPTLDQGSENTQTMNLLYGGLIFNINGSEMILPMLCKNEFHGESYSSICSNGYTYQPKNTATFGEAIKLREWGRCPIATVHHKPAPAVRLEVAA